MVNKRNKNGLDAYKLENVHFNEVEKREYRDWADNTSDILRSDLLPVVEGGFKVSYSFDEYNETYICSITGKKPPNPKLKNQVFVLRHADFEKVGSLAVYFFTVLLDQGRTVPKAMVSETDW